MLNTEDVSMPEFNYHLDQSLVRQAHSLNATSDFRVLRRLPAIGEIWCQSSPFVDRDGVIRVGVLDTETTGLNPATDKLLELAFVFVEICATTGKLLHIEPPLSWCEDPQEPLCDDIARLTGLTDVALAGQQFDERVIYAALEDVQAIVAHHAAFDFPFVKRRFPALSLPWVCSLKDIQWDAFGLGAGGKSIGALLTESGFFMADAHRAGPDSWALAVLLVMLASDGRTRLAHLIQAAQRPTHRLWAKGAPFAIKDCLKAAGYRWNQTQRAWCFESDSERIDHERNWLISLCPGVKPEIETITWFDRHAR
jgi:DNA polymerase III subunit epsilon